jgi:hypothetical protein
MLVYKYGETCDELGYDLLPFAIETYASLAKAAIKHLKILQTMALDGWVCMLHVPTAGTAKPSRRTRQQPSKTMAIRAEGQCPSDTGACLHHLQHWPKMPLNSRSKWI